MKLVDWKQISTVIITAGIFALGGYFLDFQSLKAEVREVKEKQEDQDKRIKAADKMIKFVAWTQCQKAIKENHTEVIKECGKRLSGSN